MFLSDRCGDSLGWMWDVDVDVRCGCGCEMWDVDVESVKNKNPGKGDEILTVSMYCSIHLFSQIKPPV